MTLPRARTRLLMANLEKDVATVVYASLAGNDYDVIRAVDGSDLLKKARENAPELVILDMATQEPSGTKVLVALKSNWETNSTPVMVVSKCQDEVERVLAFELGAEDYVVSPFSPRELVLRVKAILSRCGSRPPASKHPKLGAIETDGDAARVKVNGRLIDLTAMEYRLLVTLMQAGRRVVSRESLLKLVWGKGGDVSTRRVDTHMSRLRTKLGDAAGQIQCVRGFGYRLNE